MKATFISTFNRTFKLTNAESTIMKFTRRNVFAFLVAPLALLIKPAIGETKLSVDRIEQLHRKLRTLLIKAGEFNERQVEVIFKLIKADDQEALKPYKAHFISRPNHFTINHRSLDIYWAKTTPTEVWHYIENTYFFGDIHYKFDDDVHFVRKGSDEIHST